MVRNRTLAISSILLLVSSLAYAGTCTVAHLATQTGGGTANCEQVGSGFNRYFATSCNQSTVTQGGCWTAAATRCEEAYADFHHHQYELTDESGGDYGTLSECQSKGCTDHPLVESALYGYYATPNNCGA